VSSPCTATLPGVPLHGTPGLLRLARVDLPLTSLLPLLPQQAGCRSSLHCSSSPVRVPRFPQPLWTTGWYMHRRLLRDSRRGVPGQRHGAALAGAASRWRNAVSQGHLVAPQGSGPAGTALRPQGRSVERATRPTPPSSTAAPLGAPPRRGLRGVQATKSSRTRGRNGVPVCAAVGGPVSAAADTTSPPDCPRLTLGCQATASGPLSARQRARTDAAPRLPSPPPRGHSGKHRRRTALPVPLLPATPQPPLGGFADRLLLLAVCGCAAPAGCSWRLAEPPWASSESRGVLSLR
jgi:hypothetical protein